MQNIQIRSYNDKDEKGWVTCRVNAFLNTSYFDNVLIRKEKYKYDSIELVASYDRKIIGLIDVEIEKNIGELSFKSEKLSAIIWHIAVEPDFARNKIGTNLLNEVESMLIKNKIYNIQAWTRDDNSTRLWYEKNGFKIKYKYYHLYIENKVQAEIVGIIQKNENFRLSNGLVHYTGNDFEKIKNNFDRYHECVLYEKEIKFS